MSRGLWFVAGAGAGVYAAVRARRAAEILTVDGLRDRVGAAVIGARMFRDEVALGRAEAEAALRERLSGGPDGPRQLSADGSRPASAPDPALDPTPAAARETARREEGNT